MERIASFCVDHTRLERGMYISRVDGDVVTYDIRMKKPNQGDYLANGALHTIEHLFATYARNSVYGPGVIYVGPMGCHANTRRGNRPDFFAAAKPETAKKLYELFAERLSNEHGIVTKTGEFGADMKVSLLNDGPVTIILDTDDMKK